MADYNNPYQNTAQVLNGGGTQVPTQFQNLQVKAPSLWDIVSKAMTKDPTANPEAYGEPIRK